jgi:multiple sugar transport system permease protein
LSSQSIASAAGVARRRSYITRTDLIGWLFISPWAIGFIFFTAGPFLAALFLSTTNWDVAGSWEEIGLRNYQRMFSGEDDMFGIAVWNTLYFVVFNVPGVQLIALALAALLNQNLKGISVYRTVFYLPSVTASIATAYLWATILAKFGLLNGMLSLIGIEGPTWLYSIEWSMPAIIMYSLWNVGTPMLVYLASLQGVPVHLHEAAMIDGAGVWSRFRHITVPMITPAIFFNSVLGVIGSFQVFTAAFILTQGGPANATLVYILHLYRAAFQDGKMGYASALAWVLFLAILVMTLVQLGMARLWVYYEAEQPTGRGVG